MFLYNAVVRATDIYLNLIFCGIPMVINLLISQYLYLVWSVIIRSNDRDMFMLLTLTIRFVDDCPRFHIRIDQEHVVE